METLWLVLARIDPEECGSCGNQEAPLKSQDPELCMRSRSVGGEAKEEGDSSETYPPFPWGDEKADK